MTIQALICTIPRSGTNLLYYFFKYFELFSSGENWIGDSAVFSAISKDNDVPKLLGKSVIVGHGYCPEYDTWTSNPWHEKWSTIPRSDNWFNAIHQYGVGSDLKYNFTTNPDLRVIFVYRNPYDCLLSLYDHLRNHKNYDLSEKPFFNFAINTLPQFIKSYLSFREMGKKYPARILSCKYENLVGNRRQVLEEIVRFFQLEKNPNFNSAFEQAFNYTEVDKLKSLERYMGKTLANDQKDFDPSRSHIRAIDRRLERQNLPTDTVQVIQAMLHEYEIYEFDSVLARSNF